MATPALTTTERAERGLSDLVAAAREALADCLRVRAEFETFLARLYTDAQLRGRFLAAPRAEAERPWLTASECAALDQIDRTGLEFSARSFAHKRALKANGRRAQSWWKYVVRAASRAALRTVGRAA